LKIRWCNHQVFTLLADSKKEFLWLTSTLGIHRYDLKNKKLTTYYQHLFLDNKGDIRVGLMNQQPEDHYALIIHLNDLKIVDKKSFAKIWNQTEERDDGNERMHDDMVPYYIETLEHLSGSVNDDYITSTIVDRILMINKKKHAPQLEKMYFETQSLGLQYIIKSNLRRFGYIIEEPVEPVINKSFLSKFVDGDKKAWELCEFYNKTGVQPKDVNTNVVSQSGARLYNLFNRCFNERQWDFNNQTSQEFVSSLYSKSDIDGKEAICRYFNRVRWYSPSNQYLKKLFLIYLYFKRSMVLPYMIVLHGY